MFNAAKRVISSQLKDPASLQIRNFRVLRAPVQGKTLTIACGEYNARNAFGGYTGFSTFAYESTILHGAMSMGGSEGINYFGEGGDSMIPRDEAVIESSAYILSACAG